MERNKLFTCEAEKTRKKEKRGKIVKDKSIQESGLLERREKKKWEAIGVKVQCVSAVFFFWAHVSPTCLSFFKNFK